MAVEEKSSWYGGGRAVNIRPAPDCMNEINRSPDLEMVVLKEISSAIVNERNGTALLRHILDVLYRRMKMLRGTFTIRRGNDLMIEASHGLDEQEMKRGHYHVGEGITGHVAETGRPHVIEDISRDSRFLNRTRTRKSGEKSSLHLRSHHSFAAGHRHVEH